MIFKPLKEVILQYTFTFVIFSYNTFEFFNAVLSVFLHCGITTSKYQEYFFHQCCLLNN